jgi:hypothetical protein
MGKNHRHKIQDKHNCLAYSLMSLIELSEAGVISTMVIDQEVIVKPFIHFSLVTQKVTINGLDIILD